MSISIVPTGWHVEPEDPSVGIFGDAIYHEGCDTEVEADKIYLQGDYQGVGANRVCQLTYILKCPTCGVTGRMVESSPDPVIPNEEN